MKRVKNRKKLRPLILFMMGFVFIVLVLNTAFSLMSTSLLVSGEASFRPNMDIRITSVKVSSNTSNASENYKFKFSSDSLVSSINLPNLDSTISYKIKIQNLGNVNVKLSEIMSVNMTNDNIEYTLTGFDIGDKISSNTTKNVLLTFKYKEDVTSIPNDTSLDSRLQFKFEEVLLETDYYKTGLILDLEGVSSSGDEVWNDLSGNENNARLQNITYSNLNKSYIFSGNDSCAFLDKSLIPTSDDFTIETTISIGSDIQTDQAIVTQKDWTTKDNGRFKPFNVTGGELRAWVYLTATDGTVYSYAPYTNATSKETYTVALTREGTTFNLYLSGNLVNTFEIRSGQSISSGEMRIGCFDSSTGQNFIGKMNSLRLYDRVLTEEQLQKNYDYDFNTYYMNAETFQFMDYVNSNTTEYGGEIKYVSEVDKYYYQGSNPDNYMKIGDDLFRIISIQKDNTIQLVSMNDYGPVAFDASGNRSLNDSPYCDKSETKVATDEYYGCNSFGSFDNFTNGVVTGAVGKNSSLYDYLNTTVYDSFGEKTKSSIIDYDFNAGPITTDSTYSKDVSYNESSAFKVNSKVGTFNTADIRYSISGTLRFETSYSTSYILNEGTTDRYYWTMNGEKGNNTYDVLTIVGNPGALGKRRASRTTQSSASFYVRPTIYISSDIVVSGTGTETDPFIYLY